jgi:uncharacterized protein YbaA (DUF1428 family)
MSYIDGFVIPVRTNHQHAYREMAEKPAATRDLLLDGTRMIFGGFEVLTDTGEVIR